MNVGKKLFLNLLLLLDLFPLLTPGMQSGIHVINRPVRLKSSLPLWCVSDSGISSPAFTPNTTGSILWSTLFPYSPSSSLNCLSCTVWGSLGLISTDIGEEDPSFSQSNCRGHAEYQTSDLAVESRGQWLSGSWLRSSALNETSWGYCCDTKPQERDKTRHTEDKGNACDYLKPISFEFRVFKGHFEKETFWHK